MKIQKKKVTASIEDQVAEPIPVDAPAACSEPVIIPEVCEITSAICAVKGAIQNLTRAADYNPVVRESIANLAVVLADLQGACPECK